MLFQYILIGKLRTGCDNKRSVHNNTSLRSASYGRSSMCHNVVREITEVLREGFGESLELELDPEVRVELG